MSALNGGRHRALLWADVAVDQRAKRDAVRANDILARFGGDEFGLILVDAGEEEALLVAERVRAATPHPITCSIGVASWKRPESVRDLFIRADRALYEAKRQGRDRVTAAGADADAGSDMSVAAAIPY